MKKPAFIFILLILLYSCRESTKEIKSDSAIIPQSQEIRFFEGNFELNEKTAIEADQELTGTAGLLREYLCPATGFMLPVTKRTGGKNVIVLSLTDDLSSLGREGYKINISERKVLISAFKKEGILWGIQTLRQLLPPEILRKAKVDNIPWKLQCAGITDKPRFSWRGLMIDYSRTFWSKNQTEKYIDALSFYKMNKLHMHLTDDQGWRVKIDKYPALTDKASRFDTIYHEPAEHEGYYSKEDIRELVRYAEARNVEIIPEVEMPGHSLAILAAYPNLSCTGKTMSVHPFGKGPGVHEEILCAGKEETFEFIENVLDELIGLFPSEYIHVGGDEAPKVSWKNCPDCQRAMRENNLKTEEELQSWFIRRVEKYLNTKGRKLIGWDEITEGGLSKTATMMFWRGWKEDALAAALAQGNNVVLSPTSHCYFDYTYETIPVEKVYSYEPVPDTMKIVNADQVLGVQANFWSHINRDEAGMDRQIFPRLVALSETAWTDAHQKNWEYFRKKLALHYKSMELLDLYYMK